VVPANQSGSEQLSVVEKIIGDEDDDYDDDEDFEGDDLQSSDEVRTCMLSCFCT